MSLQVASLSSGSNGNCYYVGNTQEGILIDAGLSFKETSKRLGQIGINQNHVKAIFISHEHADHVHGLRSIMNLMKIEAYMTPKTQAASRILSVPGQIKHFKPYEDMKIGSLTIRAFPKQHDAADPHSFIVSDGLVTIGIFTDIGKPCNHLAKHFEECNAAFLESNYDELMLENGRYPAQLKKRIRGGKGHLSNSQALKFFVSKKPEFMTHLFLCHLSENNNKPEIVKSLFEQEAGSTKIIVAPRTEATPKYKIDGEEKSSVIKKRNTIPQTTEQLSLF